MVYVFLAAGFEECEALAPVDLLRRAGIEVSTVGVGGKTVTGAHGVPVVCDMEEGGASTEGLEMIVLPGGQPGAQNLERSGVVQRTVDFAAGGGLWIGAICAAPLILGHKGLLRGRSATCYPGFEKDCEGAELTGAFLEVDGKIITAKGMGAAYAFGLKLVECLAGAEEAERVKRSAMCR